MALCFPCITLGQLYERVTRHAGSCAIIVLALTLLMSLCAFFANLYHCNLRRLAFMNQWSPDTDICMAASSYMSTAYCVIFILILAFVRASVRAAYGIPACCGGVEDVVCSCCCAPLVTCQIMRHLGMNEHTKYSCCSSDGRGPAQYV